MVPPTQESGSSIIERTESACELNIKGTQPSSHIGWVRVPKKGQAVNQMQNLKT